MLDLTRIPEAVRSEGGISRRLFLAHGAALAALPSLAVRTTAANRKVTFAADPFALGSYSCALPGHAEDRARLAAPVENRLFFAGEACSPNFFSTAHGAYETGLKAADAALASLPR